MRLKDLDQHDAMVIGVVCIIIFAMIIIWFLPIPIWFNILLSVVLGFSLYYQIMFWRKANIMMMGSDIEDRILNELGYQVTKRGYTFKVNRIPKNPDDPHSDYKTKIETNMPQWKKRWVRYQAIIIAFLTPAWCYRDFEEEIIEDGGGEALWE